MLTRTTRDAERVLARLDPAAGVPSDSTAATRTAVLQAILVVTPAKPPAPRSAPRRGETSAAAAPESTLMSDHRRVHVRRLVLASTALVITVAAIALVRGQPAAVYAATPPMLQYIRTPDARPAPDLLILIAAVAKRATLKGRGEYDYTHTKYWALGSPLLYESKEWSVQPGGIQRWLRADGSGRTIYTGTRPKDTLDTYHKPGEMFGPPLCLDKAPPPGATRPDCPVELLADRDVLVRELNIDKRYEAVSSSGRGSPLSEASHLAQFRVLPPVVLSQLWLVLSQLRGLAYAGQVVDRGGRVGEAFSMEVDSGLGPAVDTIIADPATGELLGFERTLKRLTDPGFFNSKEPVKIHTPAVIEYTVILESERRETMTV